MKKRAFRTRWLKCRLNLRKPKPASRQVLAGAAASQIISNVPAALLLSGFTNDLSSLIVKQREIHYQPLLGKADIFVKRNP